HRVELAQPIGDAAVGVHWKDGVVVGIAEEHRPRGDQGGDGGPFPAVGVDHQHAIAVMVDDLVLDVAFKIAHAADGDGAADAVIGSGDPDGGRPAAGDAGDADALGIDIGPTGEIVDGPDAVPAFDAGRRVAAGLPPPTAFAVGAVMDAGNFTQLQRVDDQADVAVGGEPHAVILEGGFVAVASAAGVAAEVENGGEFGPPSLTLRALIGLRALIRFGAVEVAGDVEARAALEVQLVDDDVVSLQRAGDGGVQGSLFGQRRETEHVEIFLAKTWQFCLPFFEGLGAVEEAGGYFVGFVGEIFVE